VSFPSPPFPCHPRLTPRRIENYSILIATCAPVVRLFLRIFIDVRRGGGTYGGGSRSNPGAHGDSASRAKAKHEGSSVSGRFDRLDSDVEMGSVGSSMKSEDRIIKEGKGQISVKSDVTVMVEEDLMGEGRRMERAEDGRREPGGWSQASVSGGMGRG
jgi:hypothetical protein